MRHRKAVLYLVLLALLSLSCLRLGILNLREVLFNLLLVVAPLIVTSNARL
jgi:hypothetical protein